MPLAYEYLFENEFLEPPTGGSFFDFTCNVLSVYFIDVNTVLKCVFALNCVKKVYRIN